MAGDNIPAFESRQPRRRRSARRHSAVPPRGAHGVAARSTRPRSDLTCAAAAMIPLCAPSHVLTPSCGPGSCDDREPCLRACQLVYMERMRLDFEEWWLSPPPRPWNLPSVWLLNGGAAAVGCGRALVCLVLLHLELELAAAWRTRRGDTRGSRGCGWFGPQTTPAIMARL